MNTLNRAKITRPIVFIVYTLFVGSIVIKILADRFSYINYYYPSWTIGRHVSYAVLIAGLLVCFVLSKKNFQLFFLEELKKIFLLGFLFLAISFLKSIYHGGLQRETIDQLYFLISPALLAFLMVNILGYKYMDLLMKISLFSVSFFYLIVHIQDFFSLSSLLSIDFFSSRSVFEDSSTSGYFYGLMCYFTVVSNERKYSFFSVLMVILTFKRINVLFSIVLLVVGYKIPFEKKIPSVITKVTSIFFIILPVGEYFILQPDKIDNFVNRILFFDKKGLFMGRDFFFQQLINSGYRSLGLGSVTKALRQLGLRGLEMDALRMFMELGIIGVIALTVIFWSLTKNDLKKYMIMFLFFLNYSTSGQLSDSYVLFFIFSSFAMIDRKLYFKNGITKTVREGTEKSDFSCNECL